MQYLYAYNISVIIVWPTCPSIHFLFLLSVVGGAEARHGWTQIYTLWINKGLFLLSALNGSGESIAMALFDYEALHEGDLGFKKGDKLKILEE